MTADLDGHDHRTAVIIVAAGSGERLAAGVPKAFADVAGQPMLARAIATVPSGVQLVVVAPASHLDAAQALAPSATVVAGGATRQRSVAAGLRVLAPGIRTVLVHDAARALTPTDVFERVIVAVEADPAALHL